MNEFIDLKISEYFSREYRSVSKDEGKAKIAIRQTLTILVNTANNVIRMARDNDGIEIKFIIDTAGEPLKPATSHKTTWGYDAGIEIGFIHLLYNKVEHVAKEHGRAYDPVAFVIMACLTAIGHEFAHSLKGHFARAATALGERVAPLEENEADRRGGEGSLAGLLNRKNCELLAQYTRVSQPNDIVEAAFVGHWLLAATIADYERDEKLYAPAEQRAAMFNIGFIKASLSVKHLKPHDTFLSFLEAREIARKISKELFGSSVERGGLPGLEDAIKGFAPDIIERIQARSVETYAASPFNRASTEQGPGEAHCIRVQEPSPPLNKRSRGFWKLLQWRPRPR
ncbi:hypothetical protein GFPCMMHI_06398 [Ensifer adhaerens]|nr:hypothetical protein [Ensifer adhaerens]